MTACPCGTGAAYAACCGPLHAGEAVAATPEALMRSRFSAVARGDAAYVLATWHSSTRPATLTLDPAIEWRRLRVLEAAGDEVEFVAYVWDGAHRRLHERSAFAREGGAWRYVGVAGGGSSAA